LVKAPDFDSGMRGFESFLPSHSKSHRLLHLNLSPHIGPP